MAGLVPFNRRNNSMARKNEGFDDFYNMLDDFFHDSWLPGRNLLNDTFKIDIQENDSEFLIEAELPGIRKEEIELNMDDENLCISVQRTEDINKDGKNYIHRERREGCMSRRLHLAGAKMDDIKAKLDNGVLTINVPKAENETNRRRIEID